MSKINFTDEHKAKLQMLFIELSFNGSVIQGKFGANTLSPYDMLHNTTTNTLKNLHAQLKAEIEKEEKNTDEWTTSEHDQRNLAKKKTWVEFIHLMIGHRRRQEEIVRESAAIRELEKEIAEIEESTQSPTEKLAKMKEKLAEMKGEAPASAPVAETTAVLMLLVLWRNSNKICVNGSDGKV